MVCYLHICFTSFKNYLWEATKERYTCLHRLICYILVMFKIKTRNEHTLPPVALNASLLPVPFHAGLKSVITIQIIKYVGNTYNGFL